MMTAWNKIRAADALLLAHEARLLIINTAPLCKVRIGLCGGGEPDIYTGKVFMKEGIYYVCLCNIGTAFNVGIQITTPEYFNSNVFTRNDYQQDWYKNIGVNVNIHSKNCAPRDDACIVDFVTNEDLRNRETPEVIVRKWSSDSMFDDGLTFRQTDLYLTGDNFRDMWACSKPREHNLFFQ
jgi:hypothetical protein